MIKRLGLVIHWIGFICLLVMFGLMCLALMDGQSVKRIIEGLWRLMIFERRTDFEGSIIFWAAISHWPIKFIITGNKNLFPWSA